MSNQAMTRQHPTLVYVKKAFSSAEVRARLTEVLPRGVNADRIMRTTVAAIAADSYLQNCDPGSILRAVMRLAQVGLEPNTPLAQAYLVPYKGKCEPILGYRGMIELARRSGQIVSIEARAVFEGDTFDYEYGLAPKLVHRPKGGGAEQKKLTHVFAIAEMVGGGKQFDVMDLPDVNRIRDRSMAGKRNVERSPWTTDFVEMAKKTVLRRLWKLLPISIHAAAMIEREGGMERGEDLPSDPSVEDVLDVENVAPEERAEAEQANRQQAAQQRQEATGAALADLTGGAAGADPGAPSQQELDRAFAGDREDQAKRDQRKRS